MPDTAWCAWFNFRMDTNYKAKGLFAARYVYQVDYEEVVDQLLEATSVHIFVEGVVGIVKNIPSMIE